MSMCKKRMDYPYGDILPGHVGKYSRHHIIPMRELCGFGEDYVTKEEERIRTFLDRLGIALLEGANLGEWGATGKPKRLNGEEGLINQILEQNASALEEFACVIAWMPGNLIVGPSNRPNHPLPKETFDDFACARRSFIDPDYTDLQDQWNNSDDEAKFSLVLMLAENEMMNDVENASLW